MSLVAGPVHALAESGAQRPILKPGTVRRVLRLAAADLGPILLFLAMLAAESGLIVALPLIYREIVSAGIEPRRPDVVLWYAALAFAVAGLEAAVGLAQAFVAARIGNALVLSLRVQLFAHIQKMPLAFFARARTGALVSRLDSDVMGVQTAFINVLSNVAGNLISVGFILTAMFALSWRISAVALVMMAILILPARAIGRRLRRLTAQTSDLAAGLTAAMVERFGVSGAQLVKVFGRQEEERLGFEAKARAIAGIAVTRAVQGRILFAALMLMASLTAALAYGWGGMMVLKGTLDIGTLIALVAYLQALYGPLAILSNVQVATTTALVSFERILEILDLEPAIVEAPDAVALARGPAAIAFEHVDFRHPAAREVSLDSLEPAADVAQTAPRPVLHDVSLTVLPGQTAALVGPSGAGKTTITQLIARFYDPVGGSVRVDGIDLRGVRLESLYARIGLVTQEPFLFHDSVRANLRYARPDASEAEMRAALGQAQILAVIDALPQGLDTLVGERGHSFSGGERQRLAVARLLLKKPDIVILDEATAHLDSESEASLQAALAAALAGRTAIVVAHRLSTILSADIIFVVENGRVVERGAHAMLLAKGGLYADLYRRQFSQDRERSEVNVA